MNLGRYAKKGGLLKLASMGTIRSASMQRDIKTAVPLLPVFPALLQPSKMQCPSCTRAALREAAIGLAGFHQLL